MTPFQEQSLVRQLNALRATSLPEGFEERLFEQLQAEARRPHLVVASGAKRARGKLILLAAIFVPFAAAASELAWRAVQSSRAEAEFAKQEPTVIKESYTPQRNAILNPDIVKVFAKAEPPSVTEQNQPTGNVTQGTPSRVQNYPAVTRRDSVERAPAASSSLKPSEATAKIEKLTPSWNRLGNSTRDGNVALQPNAASVRLTPATTVGAADSHTGERRSEIRTEERRGSGNGEQRAQQRERLRLGQ